MGSSNSVLIHSELARMTNRQKKTEAKLAEKLERAKAQIALKLEKAEVKFLERLAHREEVKRRKAEAKAVERVGLNEEKLVQRNLLRAEKQQKKDEVKRRKAEAKAVERVGLNEEKLVQRNLLRAEKQQKKDEKKREKELNVAQAQLKKEIAKTSRETDKKIKKAEKIAKLEISKLKKDMVFKVMAFVGKLLMTQYPEGFNMVTFANAVIEYFEKNIWTGELDHQQKEQAHTHASIRSFVGECSPSSAQHWFKYGIRRSAGEIAPWLFVNRRLAELNNQYEWKVTEENKHNGRGCNGGKWIFVADLLDKEENWPVDLYGPLPSEDQLTEAANGRLVGRKNARVVVLVEN
jgi:hypothetical protein